ncbi:MAG TPA: XRE family transcriptional regulator [Terriglobales bacterium]|nr:XRE family transcriptional regulator [Terriglobales bacterium]
MIDFNLENRLAARLKAERESRGWTLAELATRSGVSKAMASKIERGEASPTATLLGRLATAFGLTLAQLFARVEEGGGLISRRTDQAVWRDPATGFLRRALSPQGPVPLDLVWGEMPAGAEIAYPLDAFRLIEDQQLVVLEGRLTIRQGDASYDLADGDCLRFGPPAQVLFRNPGKTPCRYVLATLRRNKATSL